MKTNLNVDTQELRERILDLAMQGKLVEQDAGDEPASALLEKIKAEKAELVKEGKIKKSKKLPEITDDEKPFDIPDSWKWVRLGDVGIISSGGTPAKSKKEYWEDAKIPWITPAMMGRAKGKIYDGELGYINQLGLQKSSAQLIAPNSIIYSSRAPIGHINIVPFEFTTNQGCKSVTCVKVDIDFMYYLLIERTPSIQLRASGTTFKEISGTKFTETVIPLPPLAEQRRIADKVSELFSQIDVIEKNVAEYQDLEQAMRSKLLDLAMRGKLVEQDPNDEPASELLKQIQAEKAELVKVGKIKKSKKLPEITDDEKPFDIPDSWEWVRLGDVVFNYDGMRIPLSISDRKNREKIYDYYGASGVIDKVDTYLFDRTLLLISEDGANLIARNKPIAFLATGKYWVNNHAHVVDGVDISLLTFISLVINGMNISDYISGTAQPKLTQANLNRLPIPLPPLAEQKRIADKLTRLFEDLDTIKQNLATAS
ncbi:restriction endonuclease subunit S [Lactobacillus delbrueckii]